MVSEELIDPRKFYAVYGDSKIYLPGGYAAQVGGAWRPGQGSKTKTVRGMMLLRDPVFLDYTIITADDSINGLTLREALEKEDKE
jgi:hypothetical protein